MFKKYFLNYFVLSLLVGDGDIKVNKGCVCFEEVNSFMGWDREFN